MHVFSRNSILGGPSCEPGVPGSDPRAETIARATLTIVRLVLFFMHLLLVKCGVGMICHDLPDGVIHDPSPLGCDLQ
jgi:hypothetical protein